MIPGASAQPCGMAGATPVAHAVLRMPRCPCCAALAAPALQAPTSCSCPRASSPAASTSCTPWPTALVSPRMQEECKRGAHHGLNLQAVGVRAPGPWRMDSRRAGRVLEPLLHPEPDAPAACAAPAACSAGGACCGRAGGHRAAVQPVRRDGHGCVVQAPSSQLGCPSHSQAAPRPLRSRPAATRGAAPLLHASAAAPLWHCCTPGLTCTAKHAQAGLLRVPTRWHSAKHSAMPCRHTESTLIPSGAPLLLSSAAARQAHAAGAALGCRGGRAWGCAVHCRACRSGVRHACWPMHCMHRAAAADPLSRLPAAPFHHSPRSSLLQGDPAARHGAGPELGRGCPAVRGGSSGCQVPVVTAAAQLVLLAAARLLLKTAAQGRQPAPLRHLAAFSFPSAGVRCERPAPRLPTTLWGSSPYPF